MSVAGFLASALACFAAILIVHAVWLRLSPGTGLLGSSLVSSLIVIGGLIGLAVSGLIPVDTQTAVSAGIASFFAYQLFFFLGPATADRSLTAHLLLYLEKHEGVPAEKLMRDHDARAFLDKRLDECSETGLIARDAARIALAPRGRVLARIYAGFNALYGLRDRDRWHEFFKRASRDDS